MLSQGLPAPFTALALALAWLLAPAAPLLALDAAAPLRQYGQQWWQTENGLPQNTVHALLQSRDGFLWVATDGGLARFDGIDFTTLAPERSTSAGSPVGSLAETADGTLWAATAEGLLRYRPGSVFLLGAGSGLPAGPISKVLPAEGSHLWAISPEAVAYGDGDRFLAVAGLDAPLTDREGAPIAARSPDGALWISTAQSIVELRGGRVVSRLAGSADVLSVSPDGTLWLARADTLFRLRRGAFERIAIHLPRSESAEERSIRALCPAADGTLYIAGPGALGALAPAGTIEWKTRADGMPPARVLTLFEDREGVLWIGTEDAVLRYSRRRFEALPTHSGPAAAEAFYEDREGNLWIGTDAGLLELREQRFTTYTSADGLPGNGIRTLAAAKDGMWAGTDGGGLALLRDSAWHTFTTREGLASNTILSLAATEDDSLAVGTPDGLDRFAAGRALPAPGADSLPDDFVRSLLYDPSDHSLWIGTRRGLAHRTAAGVRLWDHASGLGSDLVGALAPDGGGGLWIGTRGGLSHLSGDRIRTFTSSDGLASNVITALHAQAGGELWIGTDGGGLHLLRDGRITALAAASPALPRVIRSILEDADGDLWLGSTTGIVRVSAPELRAWAAHRGSGASLRLRVAAYGVADGMRINECSAGHPAAVRAADGSLWFATPRGVSVTNPARYRANRLPPPVVIEDVTVDNQPVAAARPVRIDPGRTRLAVHYAGLSFAAPSRVRYRYRLVGFDPDWIDAGTRRVAYYTNIPPGRYTFRVLAANNDGVWNESGAALPVEVLPHAWQSWWFRTLAALAALFAATLLYRLRVRNVELRFAAVLGERNRIAREIHDTLAQDIVGISVQLEVVSRLLGTSVDAARAQLDAARALVKDSLADARSSIWNLRSSSGDDLPARIHRAAMQVAADSVRVRFQVHGTYRPAPAAVEEQMVRVAREAVLNAVRHARASLIDVTLAFDAHSVKLSVDDDGLGFAYDPQTFVQGGHFGLRGMEERAAEIRGTLAITAAPGRGTHITLRVEIP